MVFSGPHADLPKEDLLTWIFGRDEEQVNGKCSETSSSNNTTSTSRAPLFLNASIDSANDSLQLKQLTFDETRKLIKDLAAGLKKAGIANGERVVVMSHVGLYYWPLFFACVATGAIFIACHPRSSTDDVAFFIRESQASFLFTGLDFESQAEQAVQASGRGDLPIFTLDDNEKAANQTKEGRLRHWSELVDHENGRNFKWPLLTEEQRKAQTVMLLFTSGSTGRRKAARISHNFLMTSAVGYLSTDFRPDSPDSKALFLVPPGHTLIINLTLGAIKNRSQIVTGVKFDKSTIGRYVEELEINLLALTPMFVGEFSNLSGYSSGFPSLKNIITGGDAISIPILERVQELCGDRDVIRILYGATEAGGTHAVAVAKMSDRSLSGGLCIGRLQTNAKVRVSDPETGEELGRNKVGELCIKNDSNFLGYWKDEEATSKVMAAENFVRLGDMVRVDDNDRFWFVRRLKDVICVHGTLINPADIECCVRDDLPEVEEIAVVGGVLPDNIEIPRAYAVKAVGSEISEDCVKKVVIDRLNPFHTLTGGVKFLDNLPKIHNGKIDRVSLRKTASNEVSAGVN